MLDVLVRWTKDLFLGGTHKDISTCNVLDVGTGNGRLLQELSKQGYVENSVRFYGTSLVSG